MVTFVKKNFNFLLLLVVWFSLGSITCLNDLLTPTLKALFHLNQLHANLVSFAFFIAYFIGSLIYVICSSLNIKPLAGMGYKQLILLGLVLPSIGFVLFVPAAILKNYYVFLCGLFAIGFGFTFLQIALNPLTLTMGEKKYSASRLNIAGGLNSFANTVTPFAGVYLFFTVLHVDKHSNNLSYPYILITLLFLCLAALIYKLLKVDDNGLSSSRREHVSGFGALNHLNLSFGLIALFFYVGNEVTIGANLISYLTSKYSIHASTKQAGHLLSYYWCGMMIGRFMGGVTFRVKNLVKKILIMGGVALVLTIFLMTVSGLGLAEIRYFIVFELLCLILFVFSRNSRVNLVLFSITNLLIIGFAAIQLNSELAAWCIVASGLFNSIMWPNIFDLAIDGLGKYQEQGSSFLIMMVLGAAIMPVLQGYIADHFTITLSYLLPATGYIYIIFYGVFYSKRVLSSGVANQCVNDS